MAYLCAFLAFLSCRLSLAELRCATSGFEAVLLLLAKDLEEAYGFPVLVVRPKAMFTTCYANVPEEIEEEFLSKYGDFVRNLYDNTVTVNRIFTGMRNRRSLLVWFPNPDRFFQSSLRSTGLPDEQWFGVWSTIFRISLPTHTDSYHALASNPEHAWSYPRKLLPSF